MSKINVRLMCQIFKINEYLTHSSWGIFIMFKSLQQEALLIPEAIKTEETSYDFFVLV